VSKPYSIASLSNLNVIRRSLRILTKSDRKKLKLVIVVQIVLGGLDLIGVALMGLLGALAVTGVQSRQPGSRINTLLDQMNISDLLFQQQIAVIGLTAAFILIGRTYLSILTTRRTLFFLSRRGATISSDLTLKLLNQSLLKIQSRSIQENLFAVTSGVNAITMGVIGAAVTALADFSLLLIIGTGLLILNPIVAAGTFTLLSLTGLLLYKTLNRRARELGNQEARITVDTNQKIIEALTSYRQIFVSNRRAFYVSEIAALRKQAAEIMAETTFMPNIGKYVIETTVVIGSLLLGAVQFLTQDASEAVATLTVFMAAGSRLAPAVLRLQHGAIVIKGAVGQAEITLALMQDVGQSGTGHTETSTFQAEHSGFDPHVSVKDLSFKFPGASEPTLQNISIEVSSGSIIAIVGPSGAGKTTLVDILLGLLPPDSGEVLISGVRPIEAISTWPGAIAYVPQDILISSGTVLDNVAMGYEIGSVPMTQIVNALEVAQLSTFVSSLPAGIKTQVGDRGTLLSGGQRQRLGIARALLTSPKLIVLDEATSALDGQTEADFSEAINALKNRATVILVAHRLSTVRNADSIVYISEGIIKAQGTFDKIRLTVPDFEKQAQLMGL
jgi:ATP-binding cassette, subfamily B, bacterial PglK